MGVEREKKLRILLDRGDEMREHKDGLKGVDRDCEVFNIQQISFELEPINGSQSQEVLRLLARLIAGRMRRQGLAREANSMHTMAAEPVNGRSI
jgi:hypothetical protein